MLVLMRRVGEEIIIDGNIRITVVRVNGNSVRLGVTAPPELNIVRDELCPRQDRQQRIDRPQEVVQGHIA